MTDTSPDKPAISVLMTVYNGSRFLREAVDSILNQTFRDFELICVDDGSTDESAAILSEFARRDARIKIITQQNTGVTASLNIGLRAARGEFIARMDADDISLPQRFEKQIAYLQSHPDCVLVGSQVLMVDPDAMPIYPKRDTSYDHEQILDALLDKGWPIVHPSVMIRAQVMRSIGGYDEQYRVVQDHDLFLRLADHGRLVNLREILLLYRQHFDAIGYAKAQLQAEMVTLIVRCARARRGLPMNAKLDDTKPRDRSPSHCRKQWVWAAVANGYRATARKHAIALLRESPGQLDSWKLMLHALAGRRNSSGGLARRIWSEK
jgi:glycosyltransferase involved in cell wall biosynthesis